MKERLIPLLVGFSTLALVLAVIINEIHSVGFIEKMNIDWTKNFSDRETSPQKKDAAGAENIIIILCWIFGFFLSIFLLGFHISIALFVFVFLKIEGKAGWLKAIVTAGIAWATIFVIFEWAMDFGLFDGVLFGEIIPPV
jgi:hypothetical protein